MIAVVQQCFWTQAQPMHLNRLPVWQNGIVPHQPKSPWQMESPTTSGCPKRFSRLQEWGQSWIVPLGGIAELGYKFEWKNAQRTLPDEDGRELTVVVHHGWRAMIDRLERQQIRLLRRPSY